MEILQHLNNPFSLHCIEYNNFFREDELQLEEEAASIKPAEITL
jgi:hypothetical protein